MDHRSSEGSPAAAPREIFRARAPDGLDLPIIDVTKPAFALSVSEAELRSRVEAFLREPQPLDRLPGFLRDLVLAIVLRRSVLAHGIRGARGGYLTGMATYLLKLGPDHLPASIATP